MPLRNLIVSVLSLAALVAAQERIPLTLLKTDGGGALYRCGEQRILVLKGGAHELGRQHGALLGDEVKAVLQATLQWTKRMGVDEAALAKIAASHEPHVPARCREEMAGLAAGAGVPLELVRLAHAMPERFHCSGAAVARSATTDGQLYHSRSLDYALDIGDETRIQSHALLIVRDEEGAVASAVPAWAGFLGAVTGINDAGVTIGEMGSDSKDEDFAGVPMIFLLRDVLATCKTLDQAIGRFEGGPRTCGYNFIVGSGDERTAAAIEVTRNHVFVARMNDAAEDVEPHHRLEDAVRRSNHFVGAATAATQREVYDPRVSRASSWRLYQAITDFLVAHHGKLDAARMIELLRAYPPAHGCLHQAVMEGGARAIWVAQAGDDRKLPFAGAQNMDFQRYELRALRARGEALTALVARGPAKGSDAALTPIVVPRTLNKVCEVGTKPPPGIEFQGELAQTTRTFRVERWRAAAAEGYPAAELYLPAQRDERTAPLVVVSSGDPRLRLDRTLCSALAQRGVALVLVPIFTDAARDAQGSLSFLAQAPIARALLARTGATGTPAFLGIGLGGRVALDAAECDAQDMKSKPKVVIAFGGMDLGATPAERQRWLKFSGIEPTVFDAWLARLRAIQDGLTWKEATQRALFLGLRGEKALAEAQQEALLARLQRPEQHWYEGGFGRLALEAAAIADRVRAFVSADPPAEQPADGKR